MATPPPTNQQLQQQITALQAQVTALSAKEAADVASLQLQIHQLQNPTPTPPTGRVPAAVVGSGWTAKQNWNFGTGAGNNVTSWAAWQAAGWKWNGQQEQSYWGCESFDATGNTNVVVQSDRFDLMAYWNGGTIPTQPAGQGSGNNTLFGFAANYNAPATVGYYEASLQVPSVMGAWPVWWCIGWDAAGGYTTWGPEIDFCEFNGTATTVNYSTLHCANNTTGKCFTPAGGAPGGTAATSQAVYQLQPWNAGDFLYTPSPPLDLAAAFHRYGCKINPDFSIEIWIDDVKMGVFHATQFCGDDGTVVTPQLILSLSLGASGGTVSTADFGGANNTGPGNKFRLSMKNIQLWGP